MSTQIHRIVIGDVHGHYDALIQLLELVCPRKDDQVYFLGDLIDRGPNSKGVLELVQQEGYPCLLGNHEAVALGALRDDSKSYLTWIRNGGNETLKEYGGVAKGLEVFDTCNRDWLESLPLYFDLEELLLVHAGLDPYLPLEEHTAEECCWIREEFLENPKPPLLGEKVILVGHTITFTLKTEDGSQVPVGNLAQGPNWYDLETGAFHQKSGWLTALNWETQTVFQVNSHTGETRIRGLAESTTRVKHW